MYMKLNGLESNITILLFIIQNWSLSRQTGCCHYGDLHPAESSMSDV